MYITLQEFIAKRSTTHAPAFVPTHTNTNKTRATQAHTKKDQNENRYRKCIAFIYLTAKALNVCTVAAPPPAAAY